MREYVEIGCVPFDMDCAQVGQPNYTRDSQIECIVFKKQLIRHALINWHIDISDLRDNIAIKTFRHDFGSYRELVVYYDPSSENETAFAFWLEGEAASIAEWDSQAKVDLVSAGYSLPFPV